MWFGFISSLSLLIPVSIGLLFHRRNGRLQNYFLGFLIFSVVFESISSFMALKGINNLGMFKVFLICDFLFFTWFFFKCFSYPHWLKYLSVFMLLLIGLYFTLLSKFSFPAGLFFASTFLFFIVQSIQVFIYLLDDSEPLNHPIFWVALARLIYFLIIFIIYVYPSIAPDSYDNTLFSIVQPIINQTANIMCNILFAISFLCKRVQI